MVLGLAIHLNKMILYLPRYLPVTTFFVPLCRSKFPSAIIFLLPGELPVTCLLKICWWWVLSVFLPDKDFISSSFLQWRTVIPGRWEPNQVTLTLAPAYCLEHGRGRGNPDRVWKCRWVEVHGGKVAECEKQSTRGRRAAHRENSRDRRDPWVFSRVLISTNIWGDHQRPEKKHLERPGEQWPLLPQCLFLQTRLANLITDRMEDTEGSCLSCGNWLALD